MVSGHGNTYLHRAARGMTEGTFLANLCHGELLEFSQMIENTVYNLTIIYGEKVGGVLVSRLSEILTEFLIQHKSKKACEAIATYLEVSIDLLVTRGATSFILNQTKQGKEFKKAVINTTSAQVSRGMSAIASYTGSISAVKTAAESIGQELGAKAAKHFADVYIGKGKLSTLINTGLLELEKRAQEEQLRNLLLVEKQMLLSPTDAAAKRELLFIAEDKKKEQIKLIEKRKQDKLEEQKRLEEKYEAEKKEKQQKRQQTLAKSSYAVSGFLRIGHACSDLLSASTNTAIKTTEVVTSAAVSVTDTAVSAYHAAKEVVTPENIAATAETIGAGLGFFGTLALKQKLKETFGFDFSDTQDPIEFERRRNSHGSKIPSNTLARKSARLTGWALTALVHTVKVPAELGYECYAMLRDAKDQPVICEEGIGTFEREESLPMTYLIKDPIKEKAKQLQLKLQDERQDAEYADFRKNAKIVRYWQTLKWDGWKPTAVDTDTPIYEEQKACQQRVTAEMTKAVEERVGFTCQQLVEMRLQDTVFCETYSAEEKSRLKEVMGSTKNKPKLIVIPAQELHAYNSCTSGVFVPCVRDEQTMPREWKAQSGTVIISDKRAGFYHATLDRCEPAQTPCQLTEKLKQVVLKVKEDGHGDLDAAEELNRQKKLNLMKR